MQYLQGDIWNYHKRQVLNKKSYIIIPTNLGFKKDGNNVMGRGLAYQCATKYPEIPKIYGEFCKNRIKNDIKKQLLVLNDYRLIMFPTKKIILEAPHLSWKQFSDTETIEKSLIELVNLQEFKDGHIMYVPLVGAGNGGLDKQSIINLLKKYLSNKLNVYIVDKNL